MISLRFDQATRLSGGTLRTVELGDRTFAGVSIDTRTLRPGELFFAIRGERTDGHKYLEQAVAKGAAGVVVENRHSDLAIPGENIAVITVEDCHDAMIALASRYRERVDAKFVGITGSNGKTTTKEVAHALLSAVAPSVYKSPGNLNNTYGMPLAIFGMPQETRIAVMEMGISQPGEMTRLARIIRPDVAAITNVGPTHLEFLGSVEGVARAKLEVVTASDSDMKLIINADDPVLYPAALRLRPDPVTFGLQPSATYHPESVTTEEAGVTSVVIEGRRFRMPLFGHHQVYNLLTGYAIARTLGFDFDGIDTEAIKFETAPMRGQTATCHGVTMICDCYNANPESVRLGLTSFAELRAGLRRVAVLGDMLELGTVSDQMHRDLGRRLAELPLDLAILVGPQSRLTLEAALSAGMAKDKLRHFSSAEEAAIALPELLRQGDIVYLKGSRGIGLEALVTVWQQKGATR